MDRYREERAKIEKRLAEGGAIDEEQEFQSSDDEKVPKKVEEEKKEPQQMMMQQQLPAQPQQLGGFKGAALVSDDRGRKAKTEQQPMQGFYRPRQASACDFMSDEEVDSDELGSDIEGNRAQGSSGQPQQQIPSLTGQLLFGTVQQLQNSVQPQNRKLSVDSAGSSGS